MSDISAGTRFVAIIMLLSNLFSVMWGSALAAASGHFISTSNQEKRGIKAVVTATFVLLVVHVILAFGDTMRTFGEGFGDVVRVNALSPVFVAGMCVNAATAALVQSFYAWRCYHLLGNRIILLLGLGVLIVFCFGSQVVAQIVAFSSDDPVMFMTNGGSIQAFVYLRLPYIAAIIIDTLLFVLTLLALHRAQALGSAQGVGKFVQRLVTLTITSFALTTSFCTVLLIVSALNPGVFWSLCLSSSDFYSFTLLVWLYSRRTSNSVSGSNSASGSDAYNSLNKSGPRRSSHFRLPSGPTFENAIHVQTTHLTKTSNSAGSESQGSSAFDEKDSVIQSIA